jgi:TRAP transporter TAXI family solute receptor
MQLARILKKSAHVLASALAAATLMAAPASAQKFLAFSGGPDGGTFQYFSNGMSTYLSKHMSGMEISNMASAGSVENLRRLNSKDADFGITYSGDLYLGRNGRLTKDTNKYRNVHAVAYLYGAPAHLIVLENSGITTVEQLKGKKIAVGAAGSGAAASAQRYFESVGIWNDIDPQYIGYNQGAAALGDNQVAALWVFAGYPNSSVIQAAASNPIRLIQVYEEAQKNGKLFKDFPFYSKVIIPAGTYQGVDYDVVTVQDSALWTAGRHLPEDVVYNAAKQVFSGAGLKYLVSVKSTAKAMSINSGLTGIVTPVHKGAQKFWTENGKTLTGEQK